MESMKFSFDDVFSAEEKIVKRVSETSDFLIDSPFPHVVIDDFLPVHLAHKLCEIFPTTADKAKRRGKTSAHKVYGNLKFTMYPGSISKDLEFFFQIFNAKAFIEALEELTNISGLIGDSFFEGAGLHQTFAGGSLNLHTDFTLNKRMQARRRLNLIIYLERDWDISWGGELVLRGDNGCEKFVVPQFNRAVIFETSGNNIHGQPYPLSCPAEKSRKSMALYYYDIDSFDQRVETQYFMSRHNTFLENIRILMTRKNTYLKKILDVAKGRRDV